MVERFILRILGERRIKNRMFRWGFQYGVLEREKMPQEYYFKMDSDQRQAWRRGFEEGQKKRRSLDEEWR